MDVLGLSRARNPEEIGEAVAGLKQSIAEQKGRLERADAQPYAVAKTTELPVFGMGLDTRAIGTLTTLGEKPGRFIAMPEVLRWSPSAYAVSIFAADEMDPVYREGDLALVDPQAPLRPDCEVVLRRDIGGGVLIRTLTGATHDQWRVRTCRSEKEELLSRSDWPTVHPIIGKYSR